MIAARYLIVALATLSLAAGCTAPPTVASNGLGVPVPADLKPAEGQFTARPVAPRPDARAPAAPATQRALAGQPTAAHFLAPGETSLKLDPMKAIFLTFEYSPPIRVAYLKYAAEKARYDYIIATWTSTTPGFALGPRWERSILPDGTRSEYIANRGQVFLDQNFLDTSRLRLFGEVLNEDFGETHGYHPSAGASLRFPLWGSREALQRSSEQIFQQNRVNDAQLAYVGYVRDELKWALVFYYDALGILQRVAADKHLIEDLEHVADRMREAASPDPDRQRLQAAITTATTQLRERESNYAIEVLIVKRTIGLPMDLGVTLADETFDPFGGLSRDELLDLAMRTDPEIATLANAVKNAETQLALARKGRLDVAVNLGASSNMRGSGTWTGRQEYRADAGLEVRLIDPRISDNLAREASADVARYQEDQRRRRNQIYVGAMDPLIKAKSLAINISDTKVNIDRYRRDFRIGTEEYFAGRMNVDDLIRRRQSLHDEEIELADARSSFGIKMANLASATGKFFEILQQRAAADPPPPPARGAAKSATHDGDPFAPLASEPP